MISNFNFPFNAFVLCADQGIGLDLVSALLNRPNANLVYATCRKPDTASQLQQLFSTHPKRLRILALDATREEDFSIAVNTIERETNCLHLFIHTLAVANIAPTTLAINTLNLAEANQHFSVNSLSVLLAAKYFMPLLANSPDALFTPIIANSFHSPIDAMVAGGLQTLSAQLHNSLGNVQARAVTLNTAQNAEDILTQIISHS